MRGKGWDGICGKLMNDEQERETVQQKPSPRLCTPVSNGAGKGPASKLMSSAKCGRRYGDAKELTSEPAQVWQGPIPWLVSIQRSHSTLGISHYPAQHRSWTLLTAVAAKLERDGEKKKNTQKTKTQNQPLG